MQTCESNGSRIDKRIFDLRFHRWTQIRHKNKDATVICENLCHLWSNRIHQNHRRIRCVTTQSEQILEDDLGAQLTAMGYAMVDINDEASMLTNLKAQLRRLQWHEADCGRVHQSAQ